MTTRLSLLVEALFTQLPADAGATDCISIDVFFGKQTSWPSAIHTLAAITYALAAFTTIPIEIIPTTVYAQPITKQSVQLIVNQIFFSSPTNC